MTGPGEQHLDRIIGLVGFAIFITVARLLAGSHLLVDGALVYVLTRYMVANAIMIATGRSAPGFSPFLMRFVSLWLAFQVGVAPLLFGPTPASVWVADHPWQWLSGYVIVVVALYVWARWRGHRIFCECDDHTSVYEQHRHLYW